MKTIKVIFENGNFVITKINGTIEEIKDYYIGNFFNLGTDEDNLQKAVNVEFIEG